MYYGSFIDEVLQLKKSTKKIYDYGAGLRGKELYHILFRNGILIDGFIVTKVDKLTQVLGRPVHQAKNIIFDDVGIIVGLGDVYTTEVMKYLAENSIPSERIVDGGKYISQDRGSKELQNNPTVEITTVLGCRVQCKYCPQSLLLKKYFSCNKKRLSIMSLDNFKKIVQNTPDNCDFMFAGMAEPFLNPECLAMLKIACNTGRNVSLYTTLEGAKEDDIDGIISLPLQFFGLHVADREGCAKITVDEQYIKNVEKLVNSRKVNGENFINDISAQAEPVSELVEILENKYEVLISLQDRAGNLLDDKLAKREQILTNEKITCCFSGPKLNNHVVLPDGTLLLCNMDYGMQHVLGNLLEDNYDNIRKGSEMKRVFRGISGYDDDNILCKKCLFAMVKSN